MSFHRNTPWIPLLGRLWGPGPWPCHSQPAGNAHPAAAAAAGQAAARAQRQLRRLFDPYLPAAATKTGRSAPLQAVADQLRPVAEPFATASNAPGKCCIWKPLTAIRGSLTASGQRLRASAGWSRACGSGRLLRMRMRLWRLRDGVRPGSRPPARLRAQGGRLSVQSQELL